MTPDEVEVAKWIGTGLVGLLSGLGIGTKRARDAAGHGLDRAERTLVQHSLMIEQLKVDMRDIRGDVDEAKRAIEGVLAKLTENVMAVREDIASLRGALGFERRQNGRNGTTDKEN